MNHPLDGARQRVAWAREHFERLNCEFDQTPPSGKTISVRSEYERQAQKITVYIDSVPEIPLSWARQCSECLFNLRAALDYLAWQLAIWNLQRQNKTREPFFQTQYPIATSEKKFKSSQVQDLFPDHVAIIKRAQPHGPDHMAQYSAAIAGGMKPEPLAKLHVVAHIGRLNNTDKHRLLQPAVASAAVRRVGEFTSHDCEVEHPNFYAFGEAAFQVDAKWADFDVVRETGDNPRVDVPIDIEPTLAFGDTKILLNFPVMERYVLGMIGKFDGVF